jgi:hypothetical protein
MHMPKLSRGGHARGPGHAVRGQEIGARTMGSRRRAGEIRYIKRDNPGKYMDVGQTQPTRFAWACVHVELGDVKWSTNAQNTTGHCLPANGTQRQGQYMGGSQSFHAVSSPSLFPTRNAAFHAPAAAEKRTFMYHQTSKPAPNANQGLPKPNVRSLGACACNTSHIFVPFSSSQAR